MVTKRARLSSPITGGSATTNPTAASLGTPERKAKKSKIDKGKGRAVDEDLDADVGNGPKVFYETLDGSKKWYGRFDPFQSFDGVLANVGNKIGLEASSSNQPLFKIYHVRPSGAEVQIEDKDDYRNFKERILAAPDSRFDIRIYPTKLPQSKFRTNPVTPSANSSPSELDSRPASHAIMLPLPSHDSPSSSSQSTPQPTNAKRSKKSAKSVGVDSPATPAAPLSITAQNTPAPLPAHSSTSISTGSKASPQTAANTPVQMRIDQSSPESTPSSKEERRALKKARREAKAQKAAIAEGDALRTTSQKGSSVIAESELVSDVGSSRSNQATESVPALASTADQPTAISVTSQPTKIAVTPPASPATPAAHKSAKKIRKVKPASSLENPTTPTSITPTLSIDTSSPESGGTSPRPIAPLPSSPSLSKDQRKRRKETSSSASTGSSPTAISATAQTSSTPVPTARKLPKKRRRESEAASSSDKLATSTLPNTPTISTLPPRTLQALKYKPATPSPLSQSSPVIASPVSSPASSTSTSEITPETPSPAVKSQVTESGESTRATKSSKGSKRKAKVTQDDEDASSPPSSPQAEEISAIPVSQLDQSPTITEPTPPVTTPTDLALGPTTTSGKKVTSIIISRPYNLYMKPRDPPADPDYDSSSIATPPSRKKKKSSSSAVDLSSQESVPSVVVDSTDGVEEMEQAPAVEAIHTPVVETPAKKPGKKAKTPKASETEQLSTESTDVASPARSVTTELESSTNATPSEIPATKSSKRVRKKPEPLIVESAIPDTPPEIAAPPADGPPSEKPSRAPKKARRSTGGMSAEIMRAYREKLAAQAQEAQPAVVDSVENTEASTQDPALQLVQSIAETSIPESESATSSTAIGEPQMDPSSPFPETKVPESATSLKTRKAPVSKKAAKAVQNDIPPSPISPVDPISPTSSTSRTRVPLLDDPDLGLVPGRAGKPLSTKQQHAILAHSVSCDICGAVPIHLQKDCPIVKEGVESLRAVLEAKRKEVEDGYEGDNGIEMIEAWIKRKTTLANRLSGVNADPSTSSTTSPLAPVMAARPPVASGSKIPGQTPASARKSRNLQTESHAPEAGEETSPETVEESNVTLVPDSQPTLLTVDNVSAIPKAASPTEPPQRRPNSFPLNLRNKALKQTRRPGSNSGLSASEALIETGDSGSDSDSQSEGDSVVDADEEMSDSGEDKLGGDASDDSGNKSGSDSRSASSRSRRSTSSPEASSPESLPLGDPDAIRNHFFTGSLTTQQRRAARISAASMAIVDAPEDESSEVSDIENEESVPQKSNTYTGGRRGSDSSIGDFAIDADTSKEPEDISDDEIDSRKLPVVFPSTPAGPPDDVIDEEEEDNRSETGGGTDTEDTSKLSAGESSTTVSRSHSSNKSFVDLDQMAGPSPATADFPGDIALREAMDEEDAPEREADEWVNGRKDVAEGHVISQGLPSPPSSHEELRLEASDNLTTGHRPARQTRSSISATQTNGHRSAASQPAPKAAPEVVVELPATQTRRRLRSSSHELPPSSPVFASTRRTRASSKDVVDESAPSGPTRRTRAASREASDPVSDRVTRGRTPQTSTEVNGGSSQSTVVPPSPRTRRSAKGPRSSQIDELESSQPHRGPSPVLEEEEEPTPATPVSPLVDSTQIPESSLQSSLGETPTNRPRTRRTPLFMSQGSQIPATQAYNAFPSSIIPETQISQSQNGPTSKKANGDDRSLRLTSPILEEDDEDKRNDADVVIDDRATTPISTTSEAEISADGALALPASSPRSPSIRSSKSNSPESDDEVVQPPTRATRGSSSKLIYPPLPRAHSSFTRPASQPSPTINFPRLGEMSQDLLRNGLSAFHRATGSNGGMMKGSSSQPLPRTSSLQSLKSLSRDDEEEEESESSGTDSSDEESRLPEKIRARMAGAKKKKAVVKRKGW